MSRNFELLNQIGKAEVMLQLDTEAKTLPPVDVFPSSVPALELDGMVRDEVSKLVHRLFFLPGAEAPRQVVFTGTETGNGTTWICAHASEMLAAHGAPSVCVVDCNLRAPALHRKFGVDNDLGLADALLGAEPIRQYARQLSRRNLWLISSGTSSETALPLLTSDRMQARISELKAEFDYVLMDVAAINSYDDCRVLARFAEGVVLVLKANSSRRDSTRDTIQELRASNVRVLGTVLNQRTFPIPDRIYKHL
jgi:Mrp family chromosome partitioning ATPase